MVRYELYYYQSKTVALFYSGFLYKYLFKLLLFCFIRSNDKINNKQLSVLLEKIKVFCI